MLSQNPKSMVARTFLLLLLCEAFLSAYELASSSSPYSSEDLTLSALLALKESISSDPTGLFASWNTSSHFCTWQGILCSNNSQQVKGLLLDSKRLNGTLPPQIADLQGLSYLNVSNNSFYGPIPRLASTLSHLDLSWNEFTSSIPASLARCTLLQYIDLNSNSLTSQFPSFITNFTLLVYLDLSSNSITGELPLDIGRLSSLTFLRLYKTYLTGTIPTSLMNCSNLEWLVLGDNLLSGPLPNIGLGGLIGISSLTVLDLSYNELEGNLSTLFAFSKETDLRILLLSHNRICGSIPDELGGLASLRTLTLNNNRLKGTIPASIIAISSDLSYNELEGNLSTLFALISKETDLRILLLSHNRICGSIPLSFGIFTPNLQLIDLSNNRLTGIIPQKLHLNCFRNSEAMGTLYEEVELVVKGVELKYSYVLEVMTSLDLSCNFLEGGIPGGMGDLAGLLFLNLSHNNLRGSIPSALAKLAQLQSLDLSFNQLEGPLPSQLVNLTKLSNFNVSFNAGLTGSIPQGPQFEMSESYKGDPHLCGSLILQDCKVNTSVVSLVTLQPAESIISRWIDEWIALPGLSLGIIVGFGTTLYLLHYKRLH